VDSRSSDLAFYEGVLKEDILPYWMSRCIDAENGGFFNCFDNSGRHLVCRDKYTWSQGRFVWLFGKLASMTSCFSDGERSFFLALSEQGADFLMDHCLLSPGDWRCTFLMDERGTAKRAQEGAPLDGSLYADCFVVAGLARYARSSANEQPYAFAKRLYRSILDRISSGAFHTAPYPIPQGYRAHGIPMILDNVTQELYAAALVFDPRYCGELRKTMRRCAYDVLDNFTDKTGVVHEMIRSDGSFVDNLLGMHANVGHTLEDMWFIIDAARIIDDDSLLARVFPIVKKALEIGWDEPYGGLLHFVAVDGGPLSAKRCTLDGIADDPTVAQVLGGWTDKLWWVHSEALYATMLCYRLTGDDVFLLWHERIRSYAFSTFPNPDKAVGEWIQIRCRDGIPQDKIVALPVKDPYHIARNLILMIELLSEPS
jgi:N-acylglucosamine 2-epimerase